MNATHIMERLKRHHFYLTCIVVTLVGICLIILSFQIVPFSPEIRAIGTTLLSVGVI